MANPIDALLPMVRGLEGSGDNAVSPKGAIGRYQIMPDTATQYGHDPNPEALKDPGYNEQVARSVLTDLNTRYNGDTKAVLAGYNAGPGRADQWIASGRDDSVLPAETRAYIGRANLPANTDSAPLPSTKAQQFTSKARAAGYSWDEINTFMAQKRSAAKAAGYSDTEINAFLGATDPAPAVASMREQMQANARLAAPEKPAEGSKPKPAVNAWEAFGAGVEASSGGLVARGKLPDTLAPEDAGYAAHLAYVAGEGLGDIPAMIAGAVAGAPVGAAAGSTIPVVGNVAGAAIGAGAGGFALPASIKSGYIRALQAGQVQGPRDYAMRWAGQLWDTAKAALTGGATAVSGGAAGAAAKAAGPTAKFFAETGAQLAAMTTVSKTLEGQLPTATDFVDGAIVLAGAHVAGALPSITEHINQRLGEHWAKTEEPPVDAAQRANLDPVFRGQIANDPTPPVNPGDAKAGDLVIPKARINALTIADEHRDEVLRIETEAMKAAADKAAPKPDAPPEPEPEPEPEPAHDPWATVGERIAPEPTGKGWLEKAKSFAYEAYTSLFNPQHPINQITRAMKEGGDIPDAENPDFISRIAENPSTRAMYALEKGATDMKGRVTGRALNDILSEPDAPGKPFMTYAVARWALEKADQAKETGVHLEDAQRVVAEGKGYEQRFNDLVAFQNTTLGWLKDSGIISDAAHDSMVKENAARIPGYREDKTPREVPGAPQGGKSTRSPVKEFQGSTKRILPIATSIMRDTFLRANLAARAYANRVAADGAASVGLATKVGDATLPKSAIDRWMDGEHIESSDDVLTKIAGQHLAAEEVPVPRNGKMERWVFADPNVARVLRGYDKNDMTILQRLAKPFANFQRAMIVLNPLFAPKVLWYDTLFQFLTKPGLRNTPADVAAGIGAVLDKNREGYDAWVRSGGADHVFEWAGQNAYIKDYIMGKDGGTLDSAWNTVKGPYRALQAWNRGWFSVMRAGRFIRGQQQGESTEQAAFAASEAAFHRANWGGPQSKTLNAVQPFFAAYLNGLEQTFRSYTGRNFVGDQTMTAKEVGLNVAKALATVGVVSLADWYAHKDEEWYKAAPAWQKDNGVFIGYGGVHQFVPFPPLIGFLFGGIPKRIAQAHYEHDPHAWDDLGEGGAAAFAPPAGLFTMSVMQPVFEHIANYSFFRGQPLVPDDIKKNVLTAEQFNDYSTETGKQLSRFVNAVPLLKGANLSPPVIDNYIQGWSGTLGMAAVHAAEAGLKKADLIKVHEPSQKWTEMPLISSFFARYPTMGATPIKAFSATMEEFEKVHGSLVKLIKTGDFDRFKEVIAQHPEAAAAHVFALRGFYPPPNAVEFAQALLAAQAKTPPEMAQVFEAQKAIDMKKQFITATYLRQDMSPDDKRQILDQSYAWVQRMSELGMKLADKAGLK